LFKEVFPMRIALVAAAGALIAAGLLTLYSHWRVRQWESRLDILHFSPTMDELEDRFSEIETPIVFIYGKRDPFGVDQHALKLSRTLSQVKTIVVPGAGHMLPVVHPQAVVDAIDDLKNAGPNRDERSCTSCNES